jgi:hypothetical protein
LEKALPAILRAGMLDNETLADELAKHPVEALLGDPQNQQQFADRHLRPSSHEMDHPMMRSAEIVLRQDRVGLGGEVAIGEEQQLNALPHLLIAEEGRFASGFGG